MGANGDWSDFSTAFLPATESVLVTAQLAYAYPQLAAVADLRGDERLRARAAYAARARAARSCCAASGPAAAGTRAATTARDPSGVGASYLRAAAVGDPRRRPERRPVADAGGATSSASCRAAARPRAAQRADADRHLAVPRRAPTPRSASSTRSRGVGDGNAVFVGGTWYALNGTLTWALGELAGEVPDAARKAFGELKRNTLAAHATAYPAHWSGISHVDDACNSYYSSAPDQCGIGLLLELADRDYNGQITHQPAWGLLSMLRLAGIEPTRAGYSFAPSLPLNRYSIRLPRVGIATEPGLMRGYVRTESKSPLKLALDPPGRAAKVWIDGRPARARIKHGIATVTARPGRDRVVDWAIEAKGAPAA